MEELKYPSLEKIIEYNTLVLEIIKVKKVDKPRVLSYSKIIEVISQCESKDGDIYDKTVVLLKGLIQKHPFASGNRRTAFIAVKDFIINGGKFGIKDDPNQAKVLQGIREDYYMNQEIKEWIKNGKIRSFKR